MEKVQEKIYAPRRLINEKRQADLLALRAKRNPERMKRILPPGRTRGPQRG